MLVVCCTQQWGDLGKSQQVLDTLLHHQGEVYTFLIQASTCQGTKVSWKCQVHTADPSLTGGSCTGCHLRVTLPSAVPEDQVSSQQAQGNFGRQDLGSRTADPSGRQCHTTAGGMEASPLELGTCSFQLLLVFKRAFCPPGKSEAPREMGRGKVQTAPSLSLSHVLHFQCCKSTRLCVHQSSTHKAFKWPFENKKKHHRTKNRMWTTKPFSLSIGACPSWAGDPSTETQGSFLGNHEALPWTQGNISPQELPALLKACWQQLWRSAAAPEVCFTQEKMRHLQIHQKRSNSTAHPSPPLTHSSCTPNRAVTTRETKTLARSSKGAL